MAGDTTSKSTWDRAWAGLLRTGYLTPYTVTPSTLPGPGPVYVAAWAGLRPRAHVSLQLTDPDPTQAAVPYERYLQFLAGEAVRLNDKLKLAGRATLLSVPGLADKDKTGVSGVSVVSAEVEGTAPFTVPSRAALVHTVNALWPQFFRLFSLFLSDTDTIPEETSIPLDPPSSTPPYPNPYSTYSAGFPPVQISDSCRWVVECDNWICLLCFDRLLSVD